MIAVVRAITPPNSRGVVEVDARYKEYVVVFSAPASRFVIGDKVFVEWADPQGSAICAQNDPYPERHYGC